MPEPTSAATAVANLSAAPPAVAFITAFGVNLGLRPDVLIAGFAGALVAIVLLSTVPTTGDTWQHLLGTTVKRMFVSIASALTAAYLTPLFLLPIADPHESIVLAVAFAIGAGAQRYLRKAIDRFGPAPADRTTEGSGP